MFARFTLGFLFFAGVVGAAPMTLKELEFLVRQKTSEAEILAEARQRRLVAPITNEVAEALKQSGASESLLAGLKLAVVTLSPVEAEAVRQRQSLEQQRVAKAIEEDRAVLALEKEREASMAARKANVENFRRILNGNLVRLDGSQLQPYEVEVLKEVRVYAVYYSSMLSMESRRFTPKLIESYQRLKKLYPTQFELIWVSCDRDEFNMGLHMRTMRMPWPAVRFGAARQTFEQYAGKDMPWLVAIDEAGAPLTQNALTKVNVGPDKIIGAIEYLLTQIK